MIKELSIYLSDISMYSIVLPAIAGLILFNRMSKVQRVIWLLVLLSVLTEVIARWVRNTDEFQNLVYYIFTLCEFILLSYIFMQTLVPFFRRAFLLTLIIFFCLFVIVDMVWLSGLAAFNSYSTAVEGLLIIFLILCYFYKTLQELRIKYLEREPLFWVSTGVLLYFSSNLFIFLFTNYINSSTRALFIIWGIHAIFGILLNVLYTLALWVTPKP
ncbi:MAG: hypothetical protein R2824_14660 [Saprospiraceae bacterium]|nr:hypothetical protein [Lewinella sp.]